MRTLSILNGSGDTKLTWDQNNPEECEAARQTVADLASRGYQFYRTDGSPADAVTAGGGTLLVRRLKPEEVVTETAPVPETREEPLAHETPNESVGPDRAGPKRRGRPPKSAPAEGGENVIAVPVLRGG
jgi:hypothetical protein